MAVQQIRQPEFTIDFAEFARLVFTESSKEYLALPSSVAFAHEREAVLQSAREAWAFRIGTNGGFESDKYQSTRTAALGVKIDGDYYIAIDDHPEPTKNILLARAQQGYESHRQYGKWLVNKQDPLIKGMLARAEQGRLFRAREARLVLPTKQRAGTAAYGAHPVPGAIIGRDLAAHVATYLQRHEYRTGYVWTLSPGGLEQLGVDNDHVEVRCVDVGGYANSGLVAGVRCVSSGRARGVRNTPNRNQG